MTKATQMQQAQGLRATSYPLYDTEKNVLLLMVRELVQKLTREDGCDANGVLTLCGQRGQDGIGFLDYVIENEYLAGDKPINLTDLSEEKLDQLNPNKAINWAAHLISRSVGTSDDKFCGWPKSRLYTSSTSPSKPVLIMNCDGGRFIASYGSERSSKCAYYDLGVLYVVLQTLSILRPHDRKLHRTYNDFWAEIEPKAVNAITEMGSWATHYFHNSKREEIRTWRKWHKKLEKIIEMPAYFIEFNSLLNFKV